MANTIEVIIKATDQASTVIDKVEANITTGTTNAAKSIDKLTQTSAASAGGFSKMQAAVVTASQAFSLVEQVANVAKDVIDQTIGSTLAYAKQVRELSTNLGISVEQTSKIIQASDDYGISVETVTNALEMAVKRGFAPNIETLAQLADEYNSISDPIQRAARLSDVFGRGWTSLTPILNAGGKAIRDAAAEAEKLGLVLSDKDVQGARALEVSIDNLNDRVDALKIKIGKELIPDLVTSVEDFTYFTDKIQGTVTPLDDAKRTLDRVTAAFGENSPATAHAREEYEKLFKQLKEFPLIDTVIDNMTDAVVNAAKKVSASIVDIKANAATSLAALPPEQQQEAVAAYQEYQSNITDIEAKGDTERVKIVSQTVDEIASLEAKSGKDRASIISEFAQDEAGRLSDLRDKRIDILMSYSENEQKITERQNKDRLRLARDFGIETERMELDHQKSMQRMSEDHGRSLRKLADSRDALAIEDEQESYQIERRRAEEDYQVKARERNEDYARQLADQNAAAEDERRQRAADRDKQLSELQTQFDKQDVKYKAAYSKQLADLDVRTEEQRQVILRGEAQKLTDLQTAQATEIAQANAQWTQWRNEHDIFFAGERQLYDDYLQYTYDQLQAYLNKGVAQTQAAAPVVPYAATPSYLPWAGHAKGADFTVPAGYPGDSFPMRVSSGERVQVTPAGQGGDNMPPININQTFNGAQSSPEQYRAIMYEVITDVFDKAMRQ